MNQTIVREALLEYRRELLGMLGSDFLDIGTEIASVAHTRAVERAEYLRKVDALLASPRLIAGIVERMEKGK